MNSLREYFTQDKAAVGVLASALSALLPALLLWVVLIAMGESVMGHIRWFAGAALPQLLVVRAYAKYKEAPAATRGAIVTLFVMFVAFMLVLIKIRAI